MTGNCDGVGAIGHLIGGGYGALMPGFGLAADNMPGAEVVLADGTTVTADAEQNPDLFWALRGGGNFGVVVSIRIRLHPVPELLAGVILFPWAQARTVLSGYAALLAPDAHDQIAHAYGPNGARLREIKQRLGPNNVFPSAIPLPPWAAAPQPDGIGSERPGVTGIRPIASDLPALAHLVGCMRIVSKQAPLPPPAQESGGRREVVLANRGTIVNRDQCRAASRWSFPQRNGLPGSDRNARSF